MAKRAIYREDGGEFLVNVLADYEKDGFRCIELECIGTLRPSRLCGAVDAGEKFTASTNLGFPHCSLWDLEYETAEEGEQDA